MGKITFNYTNPCNLKLWFIIQKCQINYTILLFKVTWKLHKSYTNYKNTQFRNTFLGAKTHCRAHFVSLVLVATWAVLWAVVVSICWSKHRKVWLLYFDSPLERNAAFRSPGQQKVSPGVPKDASNDARLGKFDVQDRKILPIGSVFFRSYGNCSQTAGYQPRIKSDQRSKSI